MSPSFVTQPNMYARGILFGKMKYELGDHSFVRCPETGLEADIEFTNKGYFSGKDDAIKGVIKDIKSGKIFYELSGVWNGKMFIKDLASGKQEPLFDAAHSRETYPSARPLDEQDDRESQKLWMKVTQALKNRDQDIATDEKTRIEDQQRDEAAKRGGEDRWQPTHFRRVQGGPGGPEEGEENLDWVINARMYVVSIHHVSRLCHNHTDLFGVPVTARHRKKR